MNLFDLINNIFSGIFVLEMIIKLIGLGIKGYVRDYFNIFDCIIVLIGIADVIFYYSI